MRRQLFVVVWVVGTIGATLLASAAVRQVTDVVGPQGPLPLPDTALAADEPDQGAQPDEGAPAAQPQDGSQGVDPGEGGEAAAPDEPDESAEPDEESAETTEPDGPATARTQAYDVVGGVVTVRYAPAGTQLVQASPATGFTAEVNQNGPSTVDVRFRSDDHESRVRAEWRNGRPDVRRDEQER